MDREQIYTATLEASESEPLRISAADLHAFWMEAADRGAPSEALDALERIVRGRPDRELEHRAREYAFDLLRLRDQVDGDVGRDDDSLSAERILLERLEYLRGVVRYSDDEGEIGDALRELSLHRDESAASTIAKAAEHFDAALRMVSLNSLWQSAGDGVATELALDNLERALSDPDEEVAQFAELAILDLRALGRSRFDTTPTSEDEPSARDDADLVYEWQ